MQDEAILRAAKEIPQLIPSYVLNTHCGLRSGVQDRIPSGSVRKERKEKREYDNNKKKKCVTMETWRSSQQKVYWFKTKLPALVI